MVLNKLKILLFSLFYQENIDNYDVFRSYIRLSIQCIYSIQSINYTHSFGLYSSNMSSSLFRGKITHNHYLHSRFSRKSHFVLISGYNMLLAWRYNIVWSRIETFLNLNPRDMLNWLNTTFQQIIMKIIL